MSSPTYPNPTVPPPGAWPSRPSLDDSVHRRSIEQRQSPFLHLSQPNSSAHHADSSEGSRRNSMTSGSIHHSPSSLCGSSRHLARFDEQGSLQTAGELPTRGEPGFVGSARLPWITTSAMDSESGPRSAPVASGRLRSSGTGSAPIRSSSSPDPWMNQTSQRSSPSTSPIDHRPNLAAGHGQVYFQGSLVPPYLHGQERRPSPASSLTGGRPLPPRKASDQGWRDDMWAMWTNSSRSVCAGDGQGLPFELLQMQASRWICVKKGLALTVEFHPPYAQFHITSQDCNKVVAQKFFPVEDGDGMYPLCERDYFARLDLICAKCDQALRASYITACGAKYHVEHFTCSECDVLFGPNDSYYEHDGNVYCHYHYSTRFAVKCVGCETAILKQFVEMNRNGRNECWHPECYMISKFWNVRLASKAFNTPASSAVASTISLLEMSSITAPGAPVTSASQLVQVPLESPNPDSHITPTELKERQEAMEMKVQQIWHVLSGYEESSAALIGDMLRAVNERNLLDIILLAERFILHVETLFAVIDDIEAQFAMAGAKGIPHAREAKQLCRKLVNLFSNMSQISPAGGPSPSSNELFTLITQLAHYLKILIRIALTGSIKLEREYNNQTAMTNCLARLNLLAMDSGDPNIKKRGDWPEPEVTGETTLRGPQDEDFIPLEGCAQCGTPIEEDCIRLGMFLRWHCACVACNVCGETAFQSVREDTTDEGSSHSHTDAGSNSGIMSRQNSARNTPAKVDYFWFAPEHFPGMTKPPEKIWCGTHKNSNGSWKGFQGVSRLEQYAFLLHIALRRLYVHFRLHHNLQSVRDHGMSGRPESEVKRMKSVTLDRKLSSTARLPQRSMVVESPAGRMADGNGQIISARGAESPTPTPKERQTEIIITSEDASNNATTVNVLRPPFARNNTSVKIIKENSEESPQRGFRRVSAPKEDDAITLGDISLLADKDRRPDNRPLLSNLSPLQSIILRHFALLQLQKTSLGPLIDLDDMLDLLDARKGQWWNKIFKGNAKKDTKKKGLFGVPIEVLVERTGSDSSFGVPNSQVRVPEFIEDIISTMRQMGPSDMAVEGVFRKNGNIRKLQALVEALDKDSTAVNLSEENVIQLAALLKRFLRELPDPLLTFRLHKLFCAAATLPNLEERSRCLHLLVSLLPKYNRDTLEVLFIFLKWVSSFSYREEETGSKMDLANLATVICPSILYAKGSNAVKDDSFTAIAAVQELLENQDEYYRVPGELLFVIQEGIYQIFAKDLDLPPKEIFRHCSKYTQARNAAQPQQQRLGIPHSSSSSQVSQTGVSRYIETATRISQVSVAAPDSSSGNYRPPLP
ncbi:Rho GTPase activator, putative [Cryptococcus gattii WM276]|uniref:Rho GTPase activator, putative n=1 Tax=Cryptococcus gattii serotype B (strain WM276 / ATCC MYA-4071) TaxID=367775 RepID=E6R825_CRYGW|nr:Rho GTPase activator, putative [Cryptococcus gattii WM276]ADV22946.1 Rho GTPase activator, putative [Cryptococcus gattii WM276]